LFFFKKKLHHFGLIQVNLCWSVDPYQVASSIDLEKNLNFQATKNTFIDVDAKKLNNILRTIGCIEVNEDDDIDKQQFNIEDYSGQNNEEIERKKRQF